MVLAVVVLACVAGAVVAIIKVAKHSPNAAFGDNTPVTKGATPALPTPAAASSLPSPTVAAPFLGTPAQSYADGAAGIVIPHARAVGSYSAAEVAAAYRETRGLLIAANLSPPTLAGGAPNAFASMLIRQQRSFFVDRLNHIGLSHGIQKSTRTWVTSFAPGTTQLVGDVIKVHGTMRATAGKNGSYSVLQITGDYLFVYAVERPDQPSTLMRVVVRYRWMMILPRTTIRAARWSPGGRRKAPSRVSYAASTMASCIRTSRTRRRRSGRPARRSTRTTRTRRSRFMGAAGQVRGPEASVRTAGTPGRSTGRRGAR